MDFDTQVIHQVFPPKSQEDRSIFIQIFQEILGLVMPHDWNRLMRIVVMLALLLVHMNSCL
jgi:hypothetical protein